MIARMEASAPACPARVRSRVVRRLTTSRGRDRPGCRRRTSPSTPAALSNSGTAAMTSPNSSRAHSRSWCSDTCLRRRRIRWVLDRPCPPGTRSLRRETTVATRHAPPAAAVRPPRALSTLRAGGRARAERCPGASRRRPSPSPAWRCPPARRCPPAGSPRPRRGAAVPGVRSSGREHPRDRDPR